MATVPLVDDEQATGEVAEVFADIRRTRGTNFINNFWRALAADPRQLRATWEEVKTVMGGDGALDPLVKEMIYVAVSVTNGCAYCVHSHTAAASAKGMTQAQYAELLSVAALAGRTNQLANALGVPVDPVFDSDRAETAGD